MTLFRGVMRWILAKALDPACVRSRLSRFYYLSLSLIRLLLLPTLLCVRFSFHVQFPSFLDFRVQYQHCFCRHCFCRHCFQFIAPASIILPRFHSCRLHSQSFVYSLFHLVSLTRHPYNMSPIMTFLVSGLLPFVSASLRRLLFWGF
jgi:hypothetical protein